jgi:hypothetical protein
VLRNGRHDKIDRLLARGLSFTRRSEPVAQPVEQLTFNQ